CFAATRYGHGTKMSPNDLHAPFNEPQYYVINPTNSRGALHNRVKHRLNICRRATDDAEHLGGRGLILKGLAQFCIALLQFLEQPHVLDRNDCLIGKGLEQLDLFLCKGTDFCPANVDRSDGNSLSKQRCGKYGSNTVSFCTALRLGKLGRSD